MPEFTVEEEEQEEGDEEELQAELDAAEKELQELKQRRAKAKVNMVAVEENEKARKREQKRNSKNNKNKDDEETPVEVASHIGLGGFAYHVMWSGEVSKLRNGLLTEAQAYLLCLICLLLPWFPNGYGYFSITFMAIRCAIEHGKIEGMRMEIISIIFSQLTRVWATQLLSPEMRFVEAWVDRSIIQLFVFCLEIVFCMSLAMYWMATAEPSHRWQATHMGKLAWLLLGLCALHNPSTGPATLQTVKGLIF